MKKILFISAVLLAFVFPAFCFTQEEADTFASQAYRKALEAIRNQDIELASMYFINALSFRPGSMEVITDYVSLILDRAKVNTALSNDTLNALDNFLNAQVMTVKPDDLPKIVVLRSRVSDVRESILQNLAENRESQQNRKDVEFVLKKCKESINKSKTLKEYIMALEHAQEAVSYYAVDDTEIADDLQNAIMLRTVIENITELIASSKTKGLEPMQTYYLQLAESSLQQLALLSASIPPDVRKSLMTVKTAVEDRVNEVSATRSASVVRDIQDSYVQVLIEISDFTTQQKKIERLNDFLQSISLKAQAITAEKYSHELRSIIYEIQEQILKCRNEQETAYSHWALSRMNTMTDEAAEHDRTIYKAKLRDSDAICNIMIEHLSSIDTRLLNFGAQHCFSRLYEEYYQKLDSDNQQKLDEHMAYDKKVGLKDF